MTDRPLRRATRLGWRRALSGLPKVGAAGAMLTLIAAGMLALVAAGAMLALVAAGAMKPARAGETLDGVKRRGVLNCGVNTGLAGFSAPDAQGHWAGLDVDTCRAIAAAILGDADKVKFSPFTAEQRFGAVQSGEVDLLARNTTWTLTRDTDLGLDFGPVTFYDGQGFMVAAKSGVKSAKELGGATICVQPGTTTELNLADYFRANKMAFKPVVIQELSELSAAFFSGRCDAFTTDSSQLASVRASRAGAASDYVILPERISKEPLAVAYRQNDPQFGDIVRWTIFALFQAEENGVTQANLEEMRKTEDPALQRLLGVKPGMGKSLGLAEDWAVKAIKAGGNYGEIFERNLGQGSPLKLPRGYNDLWTKGGLIYAMPIR